MSIGVRCLAWLLMIIVPGAAMAQARPPIKIGLLLPYTGVLNIQGTETTRGVELYLSKVGLKAGGREIQLLKEDDEAKPDVGLTKVKKLVERDRVDFVVGPVHSGVALAIRGYIHEQGVPLVVPVAFTRDLTAPGNASPSIFRVVETTDQSNFPMGAWVMKNTKYRKIIIMASDFVAGRHSAEAFIAGYRGAGGEIVKEVYAPLGTADFAPFLSQAIGVQADAVWAWFAGADAIRFVKQYKEFGLADRFPLIGYNVLADDVILPAIGDTAIGIVSVGIYTATIDTPENKAFVQEFEQRHKGWPTRYAESGYASAQLIVAAAESLKGNLDDKAKVRDALKRSVTQITPPRGRFEFDQYNQAVLPFYVMKVERQGGRLVNAILDKIPAVSQEDTWKWWRK
ncbi:MAG TPA: ABC transporter substrate-binding protein [Methylomirabilota bacterium]|nr:ABC transporter substrate-binding protein [Methylomirabilota bacterium]